MAEQKFYRVIFDTFSGTYIVETLTYRPVTNSVVEPYFTNPKKAVKRCNLMNKNLNK